ncbi:unnamed protein product (macronuclear) [Paramecium tetraurelia]|uniref:Uncharacterized protein n=1 Tax=Paramecium tetraurelia TaxID=5888 RepID=A0DRK7_PARTE|nr:uncharacterized protein GSPATT00019392001 [Paramecium tetraurelia]CAK85674.1 unnamed protein product [Paramecium tetraurelia]|eukprot:XP_001453071.1 hypothetical protein (macronuclear) [Paramecium tetraurelia strain d4-2]
MYKITPPSQQTYKGPKLQQSRISQLQNNETVTEDVLQSSTEQYREQLEEMLDLKPSIRDFKSNNKNNQPDLWKTVQQIEKRMQEQEQNLQRVNSEQSEEINKLKSEIKQQKQLYEQEIEEIKYSSRIQSQKPQPSYNSYTPKNTREYSYRSISNNNLEDVQEKHYLQQLVQDLKQQILVLQQKNYYSPIQNTDNIWEQKFRQLEKQKETELQMKDQHHIERIRNLETQLLNQKQSYENELFAIRKILDEKSKEDSLIRHQNQKLQKDLNSYINQVQYFNNLVQFAIIIDLIIKSVNLQLSNQLNQQQPINQNQQLMEFANQLQSLTHLLDKKNQECEYYKQRSAQNQQPLQQNPQIVSYRQALTPTRQNTLQQSSDSIVFPTLTKQQILQQFQ